MGELYFWLAAALKVAFAVAAAVVFAFALAKLEDEDLTPWN